MNSDPMDLCFSATTTISGSSPFTTNSIVLTSVVILLTTPTGFQMTDDSSLTLTAVATSGISTSS